MCKNQSEFEGFSVRVTCWGGVFVWPSVKWPCHGLQMVGQCRNTTCNLGVLIVDDCISISLLSEA